jgi:PDZ domain-containing protein
MSTSEATLPSDTLTPRRRRRIWPVVVLGVVLILVAAVIVTSVITVDYFELVPGQAQPVSALITVPPGKGHRLHGTVLLTDVGVVENLRLIDYLTAFLHHDYTLEKSVDITGGLPNAEYDAEGVIDMTESELTAKSVALRQLGYAVPEHDVGATVYVTQPGSPAYRALQVGEVITSVDGVATPNAVALINAVHSHRPDEVVTFQVGTIAHPQPGHKVSVKLSSVREPNGKVVAFLGTVVATQPAYDLPFPIGINPGDIGGPSAGLAWTLGIINRLSGGHLTGGRTVAATGTIDPDGGVGAVGGVAQKTVAVERAGASVFFVPAGDGNLAAARAQATPGLKVFAVTSLHQVLMDLVRMGGRLGAASKGPPPGPAGHSVPVDWQSSPWS